MKKNNYIYEKVWNFNRKYNCGFIKEEIHQILSDPHFKDININKFNNALMGITGFVKNGDFIIYDIDIIKALQCGMENRDLKEYEFD
jgi:hypothetical protein